MDDFPQISVIIPALNAAASLKQTLDSVNDIAEDCIVVDGGSEDGTREVAIANGARVIEVPPGRGGQLAAGALEAEGDWFLFLHADTKLGSSWPIEVASFTREGKADQAACFTFALDDPSRAARRLERIVAWRCRKFGLAWGDQGLFISRAFYDRVGGYRTDMPLFEDVDLVRRIGRDNLTLFETRATTSAARYRKSGYLRRSARNLLCLSLYYLRIPPATIAGLYRRE